jgi:mannose-6-phosphate isomerase-like protein (cupin superfamily)
MIGYASATIDELDELPHNGCRILPVRHHFGISAFGVNGWRADVGERVMPEHEEDSGNEELYIVLHGRATFELDGERLDAPAGTLVAVPAGVKRTAFAAEEGTTVLAVGATAGEPYTPSGWEIWGQFHPLYEAGKYDEVIERSRETLESAGYPQPLYNLACCESLAGRTDDAIEHLRQAIDQVEMLRDLAKQDTDLDPIREEPAFKELVGD